MSITFPRLRTWAPKQTVARVPRHKAIDEVDRLRHQLDGAGLLIKALRLQVEDAVDIRDDINAKAVRCDEAEARATAAELALAEQTQELLALRAFRDNQLAMSDLSAQRLQAPASPPPTARRFTVGRVVHAGASPHAAHIPTPVVDNEATVEIPLPAPAAEPDAMELAGHWPKHQTEVA